MPRRILREEGVEAEVTRVQIEDDEQARREEDIVPPAEGDPFSLTCRVYRTRDGRFSPLPDPEDLREAIRSRAA